MTNGQMAPTTLLNQKTLTTPEGRNAVTDGYPLKVSELLAVLDGVSYVARVSVSSPRNIIETKKAIQKGFRTQIEKRGYSLIEILSPCPVYWRMDPIESMKFIDESMTRTFPLGVIKDWNSD
jgi:2-oxoglutarate ferredoxin oxidoreductase subunit beta